MSEEFLLPLCTAHYASRAHFNVRGGAVYIYGESVENRSHLPQEWLATQNCHFFRVEERDYESFAFVVSGQEYRLRSRVDIETFIDGVLDTSQLVYLDITGLSHHVWAPLLSELIYRITRSPAGSIQLFGVYVEPVHYTKSRVPRPGDIFALSDKLHGLRPLPGLVRLRRHESDKAMIVALLGFEGWRFDAVLAKLEPDAGTVVPVIGVPGFRAEYPFYTLEGNIIPLERDDNWIRRKFATANDPFEVYHILNVLHHRYSETLLRIAMVGTKPHALGAVLFYAIHPAMSELIYDNPVRSSGRTDSDRTLLEYDISSFLTMTSSPPSQLG
jgi:hypothetical protein